MSVTDLPETEATNPPRTPTIWSRIGLLGGVLAVTVGVLVQVPDVLRMARQARSMGSGTGTGMGQTLPRMTMSASTMVFGMVLIGIGLIVSAWSVFRDAPRAVPGAEAPAQVTIEHITFRPAYAVVCFVLTIALVIDVMKPLTLGFVMPGMRHEYGMSLGAVSSLPLVALTGTAIGSVLWGMMGDRYGRRPVLMLATLLFIATSACGAMPGFDWNLVMCFSMGVSAGGLLPLVFTLIAELTPRSQRGWVAVTVGSVGGLGGYLAASNAARLLEPSYTWRTLWLIGLPTGLVLLALSPVVPESPLFLLRAGRPAAADAVLKKFGSRFRPATADDQVPVFDHHGSAAEIRALFSRFPGATSVIAVLGIVWGVVNFGFMILLPTQLRDAGMKGGAASTLVANSALYSAPALILVVVLYAGWSSRSALALFLLVMAVSLGGVVVWTLTGRGSVLLTFCIGGLVLALTAVNAMLLPYSAEIYPTSVRATGTGFAGAATKLGGVLGPYFMLLVLRIGGGGLRLPSLVLATACAISALLLMRFGPRLVRLSKKV